MTTSEIRAALLALPREQRAELAHELLRSLDADGERDEASPWLAEIERRAREVADGTADLVDWGTARDRIRDHLRALRASRAPR